MSGVLETLTIYQEKIELALDPALLATDLADYLVPKGVPFREAHSLVGEVCAVGGAEKGWFGSANGSRLSDHQQQFWR